MSLITWRLFRPGVSLDVAVDQFIRIVLRRIRRQIEKGNCEEALRLISACATIFFQTSISFRDDELDEYQILNYSAGKDLSLWAQKNPGKKAPIAWDIVQFHPSTSSLMFRYKAVLYHSLYYTTAFTCLIFFKL